MPNTEARLLLKVQNLKALSDQGHSLHSQSIDFQLHSGELWTLMGPNGSGKSSFLRALVDEIKYSGHLCWNIDFQKIGFLPQMALKNIHLPLSLQEVYHFYSQSPNQSQLLNSINMQHPWDLASGGERQRILLAAFLNAEFETLILDEPCNHLDSSSHAVFFKDLQTWFQQKPQRAAILVSHCSLPFNGVKTYVFQ